LAIQDFNDSLVIQWNTDDAGNKISVQITNEEHKVVKNKILLNQIPDLFYKVQISGLFEIKSNQQITATNQFKVDYTTGLVTFHSSKEAQTITVTQYYGRGIIYYSSERIYTQLDNAGNVKETLADIFDKSKIVYKEPIATYADLATTYPSPNIGDAVQIEDTGRFYRWDGSAWKYVQILTPTQVSTILTEMGDISYLETDDKTDIVTAINENHNKIGILPNLLTTIKTSIVNAINEIFNRIISHRVDAKHPPIGFVAATGDGVTDDTEALLAISTYAINNDIQFYIPKGTYRITGTCIHALKSCKIRGAGKHKTIFLIDDSTADYPAMHFDFNADGTLDAQGADVGGFSIKSNSIYGNYVGEGIRLTNVIWSSFKNIDCRRLLTSFNFYGYSYWNNFENCVGGYEGGIGWLWDTGTSIDNNLNTFINCTFQGFLHGLKCMTTAISMTFVSPEFSGYATNGEGRHSIYFHEVVNVTIENGYTEGSNDFVANQLQFNSTGTAGGQVVINGLRFRGNTDRDGVAIKATGSINLTIENPVFAGFDVCIKNESSGNLVTINKKMSTCNAYLNLDLSTGTTTEFDNKRLRMYYGSEIGIDFNPETKYIYAKTFSSDIEGAKVSLTGNISVIEATGAGSSLGIVNAKIYSGTGSPEGVVTANKGSLYLRSDGSTNTTLYVKEGGVGTNTGWIPK
jgi:hypothetical protein